MNKKGFTMVELLAVIVILGILMGIAIPLIQKHLVDSKKKAMETLAKTSFEASHSKALKDETLVPGTTSYNIQNLATEGFMDKPIDPYDKGKLCTGNVKIDYLKATKGDELDNYVYKVYVKCSSHEINRIYTSDGSEIDYGDGFEYKLVTNPTDKNIAFKDVNNYNMGQITISPKDPANEKLKVTYNSKTPTICSVNSTSGEIKPLKAGDCTITASIIKSDKNGIPVGERADDIKFKVTNTYNPQYTLSYTPTDKTLKLVNGDPTVTGSVTYKANMENTETTSTAYSVSGSCTVNSNGKVTPTGAGNCTVTATLSRKNISGQSLGTMSDSVKYTITNTYNPEYSVSVSPSSKKLYYENSSMLNTGQVTVTKNSGSSNTITTTHQSNTTSICSVDSAGKVTPKAKGTCTIKTTVVEKKSNGTTLGTKDYTNSFTVHNEYTPPYTENYYGWYSLTPKVACYKEYPEYTTMQINKNYNFEVMAAKTSTVTLSVSSYSQCTVGTTGTRTEITINGVRSYRYKGYLKITKKSTSSVKTCTLNVRVKDGTEDKTYYMYFLTEP